MTQQPGHDRREFGRSSALGEGALQFRPNALDRVRIVAGELEQLIHRLRPGNVYVQGNPEFLKVSQGNPQGNRVLSVFQIGCGLLADPNDAGEVIQADT